ncbi:MAG: hypothetical protein AAF771_03780 [Pseudomonadota bacterium]
MRGRVLFLKNTVGTPRAILKPPGGHRIDIVDQYDLTPEVLEGTKVLLLGQHLDEHHLKGMQGFLEVFLEKGGGIAVMGPIAQRLLPVLSPHRPVGSGRRGDWILEIAEAHPVMAGVRAKDLTYRKGVVGFWARGTIPPCADAKILTRFAASEAAADWLWESVRGGKLFVHPGNDVWGYVDEPNTSALVFPQLLDWMAA